MTHDNVRDALEYAASLLEQLDAGGTLPGRLRQIADAHDGLLAVIEAIEWEYIDADDNPIYDPMCLWCENYKHEGHKAGCVRQSAITAVRGEEKA